jgi:hypothetical protein
MENRKRGHMKLLAFLKKIGILRYGTAAGTYKSARDAPDMLITDVIPAQSRKKPAAESEGEGSSD